MAVPERVVAESDGGSAVRPTSSQANPISLGPSGRQSDSAEELAHDARNFLSAVDVYCELLGAPGVLTPRFRHYAADLREVCRTGAGLLDRLAGRLAPPSSSREPVQLAREAESEASPVESLFPQIHPFPPVEDLAEELHALESPLRALAGPDVRLEVECAPCAGQLGLNAEALLRILFNLVSNAVEAMRDRAVSNRRKFIRISAQRGGGASFLGRDDDAPDGPGTAQVAPTVLLSIRDNGPGIDSGDLPRVFEPGFSTRTGCRSDSPSNDSRSPRRDGRPSGHGLAIVRRLVESAGGTVRAVSAFGFGTRFDIELPLSNASLAAIGIRPAVAGPTILNALSPRDLRLLSTKDERGV